MTQEEEGYGMLFYIDYLDHITSANKDHPFQPLELRLRFDLLIFGKDTLCMSVPACIKLENTTKLLMELDSFWSSGKILLQLDKKHNGKPSNYFYNRKKVLAKGMPEEKLLKHFEFVAYESKRTDSFFNVYLPEKTSISAGALYLGKKKDTDALFREEAINLFEKHVDTICHTLPIDRAINFIGIAERVQSYALDSTALFQRAVVEENIINECQPKDNERLIVASLLDRAFALANAETSDAVPLSLVLNQLTGKWLIHLLSKSYKYLYNLICKLNWSGIYVLSQHEDWRCFIEYINIYIGIVQGSKIKKYDIPIEAYMNKLSYSLSLLSLLRLIKDEAMAATKSKLFEYGLFSEAQNMDSMISFFIDSFSGGYRAMLDVIRAIDMYANRLIDRLTKDKQFSYLYHYPNNEDERKYEILK